MEQLVVLYVANAVWRVPLVAIAAALAVRIAGLGPEVRHRVWLATLALAVMLPAAPGPEWLKFSAPATTPVMAAAAKLPASVTPAATFALPPLLLDAGFERWIALAFAAAAALALVRLIAAWRGVARLQAAATPIDLSPVVRTGLVKAAQACSVVPPPVRLSDEVVGPAVVGARHPVILAPRAFFRLHDDDQLAALLHELAHVARGDFAINLACEAIAVPVCWHPVIYEIKAAVRRSREIACDAMASAAFGSRTSYARRLLALAEALGPHPEARPALVALIGDGALEERMLHLIGGHAPSRLSPSRMLAASAVGAAALGLALAGHVVPALAANTVPLAPAVPLTPPTAPMLAATPAAPTLAVTPSKPSRHRVRRVVAANTPLAPVYAPAPPPPPVAPISEVALPAPPAPPAPMAPEIDSRAIMARVQAAMLRAQAAQASAMATLRAHQAELSPAERARIDADVRHAMEETARLPEIMAQAQLQMHAALNSEEVRKALAESRRLQSAEVRRALQDAARAMAEARAGLEDSPGN